MKIFIVIRNIFIVLSLFAIAIAAGIFMNNGIPFTPSTEELGYLKDSLRVECGRIRANFPSHSGSLLYIKDLKYNYDKDSLSLRIISAKGIKGVHDTRGYDERFSFEAHFTGEYTVYYRYPNGSEVFLKKLKVDTVMTGDYPQIFYP